MNGLETLEDRRLLAVIGNNLAVGDELQNYRIAIAATAEYTEMLGGQAAAFTSIQDLVTALNTVFEPELAVHFNLVSGTSVVFENTATDGYSNASSDTQISPMLSQNETVFASAFNVGDYDIGHVLGRDWDGGASGIASLGVVGEPGDKARGVSTVDGAAANWLGLIAHEIAHQFNADHTYNGANCPLDQRAPSSAYEVGSGSTIMSYHGSCGADNLSGGEDLVFHSASYEAMQTYIGAAAIHGPNSTTTLNNNIPTISAGADYVIPAQTPFELTATGTDQDVADT